MGFPVDYRQGYEYCWWVETYKYTPVENKKLTIYPELWTCIPDGCCKRNDKLELQPCSEMVDLFRKFKEEYGFSQVLVFPEECQMRAAQKAGWEKSQIVIDATGSGLVDLKYANEFWNIYYPEQHFAYVVNDEPWKIGDLFHYITPEKKDLYMPGLRNITRDDIDQLCNMDDDSLRFWWEKAKKDNSAFFWYTIYVHECMKTKSNIIAYNSGYNNYWKDIADINKIAYQVEGGSHSTQWIDTIADDTYDDDSADWSLIAGTSKVPDQKLINDPLNTTTRGWISLADNNNNIAGFFNTANELNKPPNSIWNDIGCFPQNGDLAKEYRTALLKLEDDYYHKHIISREYFDFKLSELKHKYKGLWTTCAEYLAKLDNFRKGAVNAKWLNVTVKREKKCEWIYPAPPIQIFPWVFPIFP